MVALLAPTGTGKSAIAIDLAKRIDGEIVNYDSVQLYRGFDVGSAKPSIAERQSVPHHLFDIADPDEHVTAADWARRAEGVVAEIGARAKVAILVGGTFFYLRALTAGLPEMPGRDESVRQRLRRMIEGPRGLERLRRILERVDPVSASRIASSDVNRTERALEVWALTGRPISSWPLPGHDERLPVLRIAIDVDPAALRQRLDARVRAMYAAGLVEETAALMRRFDPHLRPFSSIGYAEAVRHLRGEMTLDDAIAETQRRTRAYAKRQRTWIRSERGVHHVAAGSSLILDIESLIRRPTGKE